MQMNDRELHSQSARYIAGVLRRKGERKVIFYFCSFLSSSSSATSSNNNNWKTEKSVVCALGTRYFHQPIQCVLCVGIGFDFIFLFAFLLNKTGWRYYTTDSDSFYAFRELKFSSECWKQLLLPLNVWSRNHQRSSQDDDVDEDAQCTRTQYFLRFVKRQLTLIVLTPIKPKQRTMNIGIRSTTCVALITANTHSHNPKNETINGFSLSPFHLHSSLRIFTMWFRIICVELLLLLLFVRLHGIDVCSIEFGGYATTAVPLFQKTETEKRRNERRRRTKERKKWNSKRNGNIIVLS